MEQRDRQLEAQDLTFTEEVSECVRAEDLLHPFIEEMAECKRVETLSKQYLGEVEWSNKELDQFATNASHELQAPLRTVIGFLSHIKICSEGQLDAALLEDIDHVINAGRRIAGDGERFPDPCPRESK